MNSLSGVTANIALTNLKERSAGAKNGISGPVTAADIFACKDELDKVALQKDSCDELRALEAQKTRALKTSKTLLSVSRYLSMGLSAGMAAAAITAGFVISPFIAPLAAAAILPAWLADRLAKKKMPELSEKLADAELKKAEADKKFEQAEKKEASIKSAIASKEEALLSSSPTHDTGAFLSQLSRRLGGDVSTFAPQEISLAGRIPDTRELREAFAAIKEDKTIPWEHISDGCYARAHTVCEKLLRDGIGCEKLFVTVPDGSNGYLKAKNRFQDAEWWYHVAPLIFARNENTGKTEAFVIDLAVNDKKPIKADEWIKHFRDRDIQINCYVTPADVYDGDECSPSGGSAQFSFEKFGNNIKSAESTNKSYLAALNEIKKQHYAC